MNYIQITIPTTDINLQEVLTAMLSEMDYEGFDQDAQQLNAYIPTSLFDEDALKDLLQSFSLSYTKAIIEKQNWNAQWEASFEPVIVDEVCVIRAPFHEVHHNGLLDVIITPKMSFGTGHHATTQLMAKAMKSLPLQHAQVLDFGSGTGVLSILAAKMGAQHIVAVDNEEWAVENAQENNALNQVTNVAVLLGSLEAVTAGNFDIIVANINRHILLQYMSNLFDKCATNAHLLLSGLLVEDERIVKDAALQAGFTYQETYVLNNWIAMRFNKS
jgi:ribosomal protein L11 methyltransferase